MKRSALVFALGLAIAAIVLKLWNPPLPENFGVFYALALFSGCFLRGVWRWSLPVVSLLISDIAGQLIDDYQLGVYAVVAMALNYSGLAAMTAIGCLLKDNQKVEMVMGASLLGAAAFFVLSNFGAFLDPRMGYPRTIGGLMECFAAAIPFARGTIASSLIFGVASFVLYGWWCQATAYHAAPMASAIEADRK